MTKHKLSYCYHGEGDKDLKIKLDLFWFDFDWFHSVSFDLVSLCDSVAVMQQNNLRIDFHTKPRIRNIEVTINWWITSRNKDNTRSHMFFRLFNIIRGKNNEEKGIRDWERDL